MKNNLEIKYLVYDKNNGVMMVEDNSMELVKQIAEDYKQGKFEDGNTVYEFEGDLYSLEVSLEMEEIEIRKL